VSRILFALAHINIILTILFHIHSCNLIITITVFVLCLRSFCLYYCMFNILYQYRKIIYFNLESTNFTLPLHLACYRFGGVRDKHILLYNYYHYAR